MVTLVEELVLLAIEDDGSVAYTAGAPGFGMAVIGAALVELNQLGRVDADTQALRVLSKEPTGAAALDRVLAELAAQEELPVDQAVRALFIHAPEVVRLALAALAARKILHFEEKRFLWVLKSRRYPITDGREQKEAKLRILHSLLGDELPTPHDSALIGLAAAGGLLEAFLSTAEIARLEKRLEDIGGLDLIARGVESAIQDENDERAKAAMLPPY